MATFFKKWRSSNSAETSSISSQAPPDPTLVELADLALLKRHEQSPQPPSGTCTWSSRRPTLLPPSPIPSGSHPRPPERSPPLFPRLGHSACSSAQGDIYIFGGYTGRTYSNDLYLYSPGENTATLLQCHGDIPDPRYRHVSALIGDIFLVWGGTAGQGYIDGLYLLNLVSREWTRVSVHGEIPVGREVPAATVVGPIFFVFGGYRNGRRYSDLWAFDFNTLRTATPAWELIEPSSSEQPSPRDSTMCVPCDGCLILFGGSDGNTRNDIWSFDPMTRKWSELECTGPVPASRYHHAITIVKDIVYIFGGIYEDDKPGPVSDEFAAFKVSTRQWFSITSMGSTPSPRTAHMMTSVGNKIFVVGGSPKDRTIGDADRIFWALDIKDIEETDSHPDAQKELEKFRDQLQELELRRQKEGEMWEKKVKSIETKLENVYQTTLTSKLISYSKEKDFLQNTAEAQAVVDFLTKVLESKNVLKSNTERKHALRFLAKTAKRFQVFPKQFEISGVQCDVTAPPADEGGYGSIYKGEYVNQAVCVKAVRVYDGGSVKKLALRAHAGELVLAAHATHPNIVPFYGAYISEEVVPRICIVSPWMEDGNLLSHLNEHPGSSLVLLTHDIASGIQHLHALDIIHSDLKASNVLVSKSKRAMLADFGVSTIATTSIGTTTAKDIAGTLNWMAPELLVANPQDDADDQEDGTRPPTKESDMWSFGCLCFEIWTGRLPFEQFRKANQFLFAFTRGGSTPIQPNPKANRLNLPEWTGLVTRVAEPCWNYDAKLRPTAEEIQRILGDEMGEDNRPSSDAENSLFEAAKRGRSTVNVDYSRVAAIVERIERSSDP